jgi:hypothetical protein
MKKFLIAVLALLFVFAMTSCETDTPSSDKITIKFDVNGGPGANPAKVTITKGKTLGSKYPDLASRNTPTQEFGGWFNGETEVRANTKLNKSVTLKAKWTDPGSGGGPFVPPLNWISFTDPEMLAAGFYIGDGLGEGDNPSGTSITKSGNAYTVTLKTVTTGERASVVWVSFAAVAGEPRAVFRNGWYANLTLPTTGGSVRPTNVHVVPVPKGKKGADGGVAWPRSQNADNTGDVPATKDGVYVVGDLSMHWGTEELVADDHIGLAIWLNWAPAGTADGATYTFTINSLSVLPHGGGDDPDLTAWEPGANGDTTGWVDFKQPSITASSPAGATIVSNGSGGYTVTTKTTDGDHTEITFKSTDATFGFAGGYYLSLTLPNQTAASTMKPKQVYSRPDNTYTYAVDLTQAFKWVQGKADMFYTHEVFTATHTSVVLSIYWYPDVVKDQNYTFTISAFKVKEQKTYTPPPDPSKLQSMTQVNPPSAPTDSATKIWEDVVTSGPRALTARVNWDQSIVVSADLYNDATELLDPGYYVSLTLPSGSDLRPTEVMITAYDAKDETATGWASQRSTKATDGYYYTGNIAIYWDGLLWNNDPSNIEKFKRIELVIVFAAGTVLATPPQTYTVTINAVKAPTPPPDSVVIHFDPEAPDAEFEITGLDAIADLSDGDTATFTLAGDYAAVYWYLDGAVGVPGKTYTTPPLDAGKHSLTVAVVVEETGWIVGEIYSHKIDFEVKD